MLVDLGGNNVGEFAKYGSVKVEKLMNIERYSHVMYITSTVTGELQDDLTCWDTLGAALPGVNHTVAVLVEFRSLMTWTVHDGQSMMDIALSLGTIVFPTACQYNTMYSYKDANKCREWELECGS